MTGNSASVRRNADGTTSGRSAIPTRPALTDTITAAVSRSSGASAATTAMAPFLPRIAAAEGFGEPNQTPPSSPERRGIPSLVTKINRIFLSELTLENNRPGIKGENTIFPHAG